MTYTFRWYFGTEWKAQRDEQSYGLQYSTVQYSIVTRLSHSERPKKKGTKRNPPYRSLGHETKQSLLPSYKTHRSRLCP